VSRRTAIGAVVCLTLIGGSAGYNDPDVPIVCGQSFFECGPTDSERLLGWMRSSLGVAILLGAVAIYAHVLIGAVRGVERPSRTPVMLAFSTTILAFAVFGVRRPVIHCPTSPGAFVDCFDPPTRSEHVVGILNAALASVPVAMAVALAVLLFTRGGRWVVRQWNYTEAELAARARIGDG